MPGWHETAREFQESGLLQVVGLIEEQHPDRCRLFQRWHRMDWPVLVDSLNLLGVSAVPLTFFLDEHGIIRSSRRPTRNDLAGFLGREYPVPDELPAPRRAPDAEALAKRATAAKDDAAAWLATGDTFFLRGANEDLERAIDAYRRAIALGGPASSRFRLGVALRRRYESADAAPDDFRAALEVWESALDADPNQYIWRRRIQQYGPRLDKPYSFYDWVREAREEIAARGEEPPPLRVEPSGAELAYPEKRFAPPPEGDRQEPDPLDRIRRDVHPLIRIEPAVAPAVVRPGRVARLHLVLRPHPKNDGHWNNESDPLEVWLRPPDGFQTKRDGSAVASATEAVSDEIRTLEWELKVPRDAPAGTVRVPGYALYSVCQGRDGVCTYLRQDFTVELRVGESS